MLRVALVPVSIAGLPSTRWENGSLRPLGRKWLDGALWDRRGDVLVVTCGGAIACRGHRRGFRVGLTHGSGGRRSDTVECFAPGRYTRRNSWPNSEPVLQKRDVEQ